MIKTVVYDVGRVLVDWRPEEIYDARIGPERRKQLFEACDLHAMNVEIDMGGHSRDVVYAHAEAHPEWAEDIRAWHDNWIEMLTPDIPGSAALLRALRAKGMPVVALTNFGWNTLDIAKTRYPILNEFDDEFVSGRLGVMKPDAGIYEHVEAGTGLSGDALLFTDDSPANVEAARARGWIAHLFEGPEGWAETLIRMGLLTPDEARRALS